MLRVVLSHQPCGNPAHYTSEFLAARYGQRGCLLAGVSQPVPVVRSELFFIEKRPRWLSSVYNSLIAFRTPTELEKFATADLAAAVELDCG
jgi:hypothetical protein